MNDLDEKKSSILLNLIQTVHKSSLLTEVYEAALNSVEKLDYVDKASIYLVNEKKPEAILVAQKNFPQSYLKNASVIPKPKGLTWKVIQSGRKLIVNDVRKDPHIGSAGRKLGKHSALAIPIKLKRKVNGIILFVSHKEYKFSKNEIQFLSSFGNQLGLALSKTKLNEDLNKKIRYEKILNNVTSSVHKSINIQDVLENAVDSMSEFIDGVNNVSIYLINGKQAVLKAYKGYPDNYIKKVKIIPYPKGTTWKTIIDGRPRYVKDTSNDRVLGTAGKDLGTKSYLSIPIKFKRKTIGCININSLNFNAFSNDELTLLGKVSKQIEASIKNAQQADDLEKSKYELKLARDNLELKVAERTSDLRALTAHIQNIREEERKQISREIHDELGQSLTNLKLDLFWLNKSIKGINGGNKAVVFKQVNLMTKKIDTSIKTVRKIATQLRPSVLDNLGLVAAIKWQLKEFQTMTSLDCEFKEYIKTLNVPQDLSTTIFRILQESLTNIARHSEAKKVVVKLKKDKKILILEVEDNGIGFDDKVFTNSKSLGLLGMKERATILGGDFKIQSQKSNGTKTILKLPI
jgi:signal transduction histidine kinase